LGKYSIKGTYYISIDPNSKQIKTQNYKEFSLETILENLTEKQQNQLEKNIEKGKDVEMYDFDIRSIIIREEGGAVLVGEQYLVNAITTYTTVMSGNTSTRQSTTTYYYYYNDIIVVNINKEGQIEWVHKIPKRQSSVNDNGYLSSYAMSIVKDKLYFLFNDNEKNLEEETIKSNKFVSSLGGKGSVVVLAEVSLDGNIKKETIFKWADAEVVIRPKVCRQINGNEMIIFGLKPKTQKFARITFK
jgi:hypothetical protein